VENQSLTPTVEKTPEEIERQMAQTRESLTEKVAALESQVVGTVKTAADTMTDTVEAVKSLVTSAPAAVRDTVKQATSVVSKSMKELFDISGHVRGHPWASVGVSALLGCVTGWLTGGRRASSGTSPSPVPLVAAPPPGKPGMFDELFSMLGRKLREVSENVIDTATTAVNANVREAVPNLVNAAAERLTPDPGEPASRIHVGNGYRG